MESIQMKAIIVLLTFLCSSNAKGQWNAPRKEVLNIVQNALMTSVEQYHYLMQQLQPDQWPRTYENGKVYTVSNKAWISGFYPGTLLYLYEFSNDMELWKAAHQKLQRMEDLQNMTEHHDLGFMMYCSYGNAFRLFPDSVRYKEILIQSAKSLATRFNPRVGCIKSWDSVLSLDKKRMLKFPVIIDNMMNLELLFFASKATGDPFFKKIAIKHAETTMKNHLRPDFSSYHVVDYDEYTGKVKSRETQQGFADNSTWSRGQAWGIYGFTMVYRETKDRRFLHTACKMADFFLNHKNLPLDKIPYWDFNVGQVGYNPQWNYNPSLYKEIPRDASAAAITASALIELSGYVEKRKSLIYQQAAESILTSLSSQNYRATVGSNGGFILKHASGGVPGNVEVDVPLSYADYYYIEALMRYAQLKIR